MGNERQENFFETLAGDHTWAAPENDLPTAADCELDEPRWSVVSFDKVESVGLNYMQAVELMSNLDARGFSGLCIITNKAASRLHS